MKKIHIDRLRKLEAHLRTGQLIHKRFKFSAFNSCPYDFDFGKTSYDKKGCGTAGCAIGECPAVFPRSWKFHKLGEDLIFPGLKKHCDWEYPLASVQEFFGLTDFQARRLFIPGYGGLPASATRYEVADAIREFIQENV